MQKALIVNSLALALFPSVVNINPSSSAKIHINNTEHYNLKQEFGNKLINVKIDSIEGSWGPDDTIQYDVSSEKFKIKFFLKQNSMTQYLYFVHNAQDGTMMHVGNGEGTYNQLLQFNFLRKGYSNSYIFYLTARDPISNNEMKTIVKFRI